MLEISENTGISDVAIDPANPDVMLAVAHQRRRHTWTLIHGGPESGLHKSIDGGKTWRRIRDRPAGRRPRTHRHRRSRRAQKGLVYAKVESAGQPVAMYASLDGGDSWERRGNVQAQPMYYKNIHADPKDPDRVYVPSVQTQISEDGGRTFHAARRAQQARRQPLSLDRSRRHRSPARGLRRRTVRELGSRPAVAPLHQPLGDAVLQRRSRQRVADLQRLRRHAGQRHARRTVAIADADGATNDDWFVVTGGDGFVARIDPNDPNIVYGESQYGGIVRLDRRTSERVSIKPVEGKGEAAAALQLGIAVRDQPAQSRRGCTLAPIASSAATIAATAGARSVPT